MDAIRNKLGIESAETKPFLLMTLLAFLIGGGNVFIDTASNALFITEYGASKIPIVYIIAAVVMVILGYGQTQLQKHIPVGRLMGSTMLLLCLVTAGLKIGLDLTGNRSFIFASLVWFRLTFIMSEFVFWVVAGMLFSLQQGKRLFGLISTGSVLARIIGYLAIPAIVPVTGSANLFYLSAAFLGGGWFIVWNIMRTVQHAEQSDAQSDKLNTPANLTQAKRPNNYIYLIYAIYGIGSVCFYLIGFNFYSQAGTVFTDADQLAAFFGIFSGVINALALLINTFFTGRLLRRFGLLPNMLARPLLILLFVIILLVLLFVQPNNIVLLFVVTLAIQLVDLVLYYGNYRAGLVLTFQPIPQAFRTVVISTSESVIGAFSLATAGIMLIVVGPERLVFNSVTLAFTVSAWLYCLYRLRREYPMVLRDALHKRLLGDGELNLKEASVLSVIHAKLQSQHANDVVYALDLLERVGEPDLGAAVLDTLNHDSALVRQEGARRAARLGQNNLLPSLREMAQSDPEVSVRSAALLALGEFGTTTPESIVIDYLDGDERALRQAAVTGLLLGKSEQGQRQAVATLEAMMQGDSAEKTTVGHIIRDTQSPQLLSMLDTLLNDPACDVQIAALEATNLAENPQLLDTLLPKLHHPQMAHETMQALARGRCDVLPTLKDCFSTAQHSAERVAIIGVINRIHHADAQQWLTQFLGDPDTKIQTAAIRGLYRGRYAADAVIAPLVNDQISAECHHASHLLTARAALSEQSEFALLHNALDDLVRDVQKKIFMLLSFNHDRNLIQRVQDNLQLASAEKQAYALELLDMALPSSLKPQLLPLVDTESAATNLATLSTYYAVEAHTQAAWLEKIISAEKFGNRTVSAWVQATAIYGLGQLEQTQHLDTIKIARDSAEPLVAQTAAHVLHKFFGPPTNRTFTMMPTIEKVIILRSVSLFNSIPEATLVQVANLLQETTVSAGETLFKKGDYGDNMYIIVHGNVRVHIGDETLNFLSDRDVFGEMALLDPEPRVASITAIESTHLLQLNQQPLFELMEDQPAVARGIIRVLSNHLRDRVTDLRTARQKISALEAKTPTV